MPTPNHHENFSILAKLTQNAYHDDFARTNKQLGGYRLLMESKNNLLGYKGYALTKDGKSAIIIHRGTDEASDIMANLQIFLKEIPHQLLEAKKLTKSVIDKYDIDIVTHVGHSLGGAIAQLMAVESNAKAVSFDSPGIKEHTQSILKDDNIIEYLSRPNLINTVGEHIGNIYQVNVICEEDYDIDISGYIQYTLEGHKLDNIVQAWHKNKQLEAFSSWPTGMAMGHANFTNYQYNTAYLQKYLIHNWQQKNANPNFSDFFAYKEYMIENHLNGKVTDEMEVIENTLGTVGEALKNNKYYTKVESVISDVYKIFSDFELVKEAFFNE